MPGSEQDNKPDLVREGMMELKIEQSDSPESRILDTIEIASTQQYSARSSGHASPVKELSSTERSLHTSKMESPEEHVLGGEIMVKLEPGKPPKLTRTPMQRVTSRPIPLFDECPDKTQEATGIFQVISECSYSSKYLGSTEHAMDCDCAEEWGKLVAINSSSNIVGLLSMLTRCFDQDQLCLWGRFGLHQPRHQNGVFP